MFSTVTLHVRQNMCVYFFLLLTWQVRQEVSRSIFSMSNLACWRRSLQDFAIMNDFHVYSWKVVANKFAISGNVTVFEAWCLACMEICTWINWKMEGSGAPCLRFPATRGKAPTQKGIGDPTTHSVIAHAQLPAGLPKGAKRWVLIE